VRSVPRLAPEAWWPAGVAGVRATRVQLATGLGLRAIEAGPAQGPPVLLVHGWGIHSYLWRKTIPALVSGGWRVHAIDLPGHGLSDKPLAQGSYTLAAMVDYVLAAMDTLGLAASPVVGQSMGGRIAAELAIRHPERVVSLVLFGAVGFGDAPAVASLAPRLPGPTGSLTTLLSQRWIVALGKAYSYGCRAAIAQEDIDAYWAATQFPAFVPALHRVLAEFDWRALTPAQLSAIRAPTLVVFGTRDRMVSPRRVASRVAALRDGRLHLVQDAGHVANEEAPDEVNPLLVEFLSSAR